MNTPAQVPTVFSFDQSKNIRVIPVNDEPWFVAVDVCAALGITNPRDALTKLDDDERSQVIDPATVGLTDSTGINTLLNIVSESGLYTLILRCRDATTPGTLPHRFRKWVTSEVLPAIRKTGRYQTATTSAPTTIRAKDVEETFGSFHNIAKLCGFEGNMAVLSANQATFSYIGVNPLSLMGQAALLAPVQDILLNPTEIGLRLKKRKPPKTVNMMLAWAGLQEFTRDSASRLVWTITETGKEHGVYMDTGKKHSNGTPIRQIKWYSRVVEILDKLPETLHAEAA